MARPVYLKWNKHRWREHYIPLSIVETTVNEAYTNQSAAVSGKVASVESLDD